MEPFRKIKTPAIPTQEPTREDCIVAFVNPTCVIPVIPQRNIIIPSTVIISPAVFIASFLGGYMVLLLVTMLSSPILNSLVLTLVLEME